MSSGSITPALRETLGLFDGSGTPLTTTEAANRLDLGRRSTYERLERLVDHGGLQTKSVGANARVWWRPRSETTASLETSHSDQSDRREQDLFEQILDVAPVSIGVVSPDGSVIRANQNVGRQLDRGETTSEEYTMGEWDIYRDSEYVPLEDRPYMRVFETGEPVSDWECQVELPTGERHWLSISAVPMEHDGEVEQAVVCAEDITQLKEQARRLERQRDELESELADIFDRISDGFFSLDEELRFTYVNERAEEYLGRSESELIGAQIWETLEPGPIAHEVFNKVLDTQEPRTFEEYYKPLDTWFENHVHPSESGLSVYFRDITDRKEREQELERYKMIVDAIGEPVYELDDQGRFTFVNESFVEQSGYTEEELLGAHVSIAMDKEAIARAESLIAAQLAEGSESTITLEYEVDTKDDDRLPVENRMSLLRDEDGQFRGSVGAIWDVSELKERERELKESEQRYRTLVEHFPNGIVTLFDSDFRHLVAGGELYEAFDRDPQETVGKTLYERSTPEEIEILEPHYEAALEGESHSFEIDYVGRTLQFQTVPVEDEAGEVFAGMAMSQDVTERKKREQELKEYETIVETMRDGVYVLDADFNFTKVNDAYCEMTGYSREELLGTHCTLVVDEEVSRESATRLLQSAVEGGGATLEADIHRADGTTLRAESNFAPIPGEDPEHPRKIGVVRDMSERVEREQELERRREQLAALNNLHDTVQGITEAVIDQSTREEIEETVCERLAESESYSFAWIGDVDIPTQTVNLRAEAGVSGYLDDITISVDPDDERSQGPTGRAVLERETQVVQNVEQESVHDPWREHVRVLQVESAAAIPIVHEDTLYGVLNVYAPRPFAFDDEERSVIGQLGEVIGHAIAAIERQRALTSDEVLELEFQLGNVFEAIDVPVDTDATITLDRAVPAGGGTFLEFGTATGDAMDAIEVLVESGALPHWESVYVIKTEGDTTHFELKLVDPPVLSTVTAYGGYVDEARIENGDYFMRIHLPPSASVRQVADPIVEAYPGVEVVSQRQVERDQGSVDRVRNTFHETLTERQRAALEAGYFAGYFEWPRETKGEAVAESLGISPATYHQHLRAGQQKLLAAALDDSTPA